MNIKFIGTGSMISTDNQACYLINRNIMIDMPNGTCKILKKLYNDDLESIKYLFITHLHGDHYFDIPFLLLNKLKTGKEIYIYTSRWCMPRIKRLVKCAFPGEYYRIIVAKNIHFVSNSKEIEIDDMKFNRFKVKHGVMRHTFGYSVNYKNKIVSFTGDSMLNDTIRDKAKISNYMICDCTLVTGTDRHMGTDNIKELLSNKKLTIIPSHMSPKAKKELQKIKESNLLIKEDLEELKI